MREILKKVLTFLCIAAVLAGLVWGGIWFFDETYIFMDGGIYRRDAETVNLHGKALESPEKLNEFPNLRQLDARGTGLTVEEYERLRGEFPECVVLWDVPFQDGYCSQYATEVSVSSLTEEDILRLDYLRKLTFVDAAECTDYPQLMALQQRRPECQVSYTVSFSGQEWDSESAAIGLRDADFGEMLEKLQWLPKLQSVFLTGALPEYEQLERLQAAYPNVTFLWQVQLGEGTLDWSTTHLSLSGMTFDSADAVAASLSYFTDLEWVDMRDCGLSDAEMLTLVERFPDTDFIWDITIAGVTVRTDVEEIDLSGIELGDVSVIESVLPCFPDLKKVVMCGCGIESAEMAALNDRHADIRFIWSVDIAGMLLRTDAVYFMPNKYGLECTDENIYDLRYCVDMLCVDVGHMKEVTNCQWAAFMPKLKYLVIADSGVGDLTPLTGLEKLVFLELFLTPVRDYSPLVTCTALEDLNLCYTYGDPEPIAQMTWLKRVWWSGWWAGRSVLPEALPDTELEFNTPSSTGGTWRQGQNYYDMRDLVGMGYMTG